MLCFSLSLNWKCFLTFHVISSLTHGLFWNVLLNFEVFRDFPCIFLSLISSLILLGHKTYFLWFQLFLTCLSLFYMTYISNMSISVKFHVCLKRMCIMLLLGRFRKKYYVGQVTWWCDSGLVDPYWYSLSTFFFFK